MKKIIFYCLAIAVFTSLLIVSCRKNDVYIPEKKAPACTENVLPANGANLKTTTVHLSWLPVDDAKYYDVYLGTSPESAKLIATEKKDTSFTYMLPTTDVAAYYWYVVPRTKKTEADSCSSTITFFTYGDAPEKTKNVSPADSSQITSSSLTFIWNQAARATSYDLYLGSTPGEAAIIAADVTDTTFNYTMPSSALSGDYFWYVVPKNIVGAATGSDSTATVFNYLIIKTPAALNFPIVGYFPSYRMVADYPDQTFKMTSIVNYAFSSVTSAGLVSSPLQTKFDSVYNKAKSNGAKVFLSINATLTTFKAMGTTAAGRLKFIKDVMAKVRQYKLDGIDLDYEYPRTTDGTDTIFALLSKQLSDSLHVDGKYYLSAAITPGLYAGSIRDGIKTEVFNYIDLFNIMVYDDFTTDARYPYKQHSPYSMAVTCLNYWLNTRGMPKQKAILGIPAYGRNSGAAQIATSYKTILATGAQIGPSPLNISDSARLTKTDGTTFTTYYNGQLTVKKKTTYAKTVANGVMFWEIGHDAPGEFSLIKAACDTIGRSY